MSDQGKKREVAMGDSMPKQAASDKAISIAKAFGFVNGPRPREATLGEAMNRSIAKAASRAAADGREEPIERRDLLNVILPNVRLPRPAAKLSDFLKPKPEEQG